LISAQSKSLSNQHLKERFASNGESERSLSMKRMIQFSCVIISSLFIANILLQSPTAAATSSQESAAESQFIDALDDCIQQRFKDIDQMFGFRRITRAGDTPHRFKPENAKELASVSDLNSKGIHVALYLTSRSVLGDKPDENEWVQDKPVRTGQGVTRTSVGSGRGFSRKIIKGPVLISAKDKDDLPMPSELWEQSQKAILAFATKDSFEFSHGSWKIIARPVRASEQSCLKCHLSDSTRVIPLNSEDEKLKPLNIGDPLGVVLYAYRERR
jgi:hypothetical protein